MSYEPKIKLGSFGYIPSPVAVTAENTDTWYPINMESFTHFPIENFDSTSNAGFLTYNGDEGLYFNVNYYVSFTCSKSTADISVTVENGTGVLEDYKMTTLAKTNGETYNLSGTAVIHLEKGDKFRLTTNSNVSNEITFVTATGLIKRFF